MSAVFGLNEGLALLSDLAKLGASPAVQAAASQWLAARLGIPQERLDQAIRDARDAPDSKETPK